MGRQSKRLKYSARALLGMALVWCVPVFAANSGSICDRSVRDVTEMSLPLSVRSVDLGTTESAVTSTPGPLADDDRGVPAAVAPHRFETSSQVSRMLREIFEEAAAEQFALDEDRNPVRTGSAQENRNDEAGPNRPAAELALPNRVNPDDQASDTLPSAPDAITELPGISEEEFYRYRRQMNRKDI